MIVSNRVRDLGGTDTGFFSLQKVRTLVLYLSQTPVLNHVFTMTNCFEDPTPQGSTHDTPRRTSKKLNNGATVKRVIILYIKREDLCL